MISSISALVIAYLLLNTVIPRTEARSVRLLRTNHLHRGYNYLAPFVKTKQASSVKKHQKSDGPARPNLPSVSLISLHFPLLSSLAPFPFSSPLP